MSDQETEQRVAQAMIDALMTPFFGPRFLQIDKGMDEVVIEGKVDFLRLARAAIAEARK